MQEIIENWFHEYSDELYGWALHKTSSKVVSEDLVQETFLSAVKNYEGFKNNSQPKTWLFAILNNKIIDHYRKNAKALSMVGRPSDHKFVNLTNSFFDSDGNWTIDKEDTVWDEDEHLLDNDDFKKTLGSCVHKLPENWRLAVLYKYVMGKTSKQACQEIQITQTNYWQMVHRAKLMLKKCIELNWKT